ncbi:hypothetical protein DFP72DRAFT_609120 [Ephemerocybe angulata]|uniref:Uncharacterized protein n=1 Tax=Ephemerocybe angulata TaxID=980116 RepID=A0A8H6HJK4_9AGAR|nr:hypothetical protein DFP72DRAFT_609120 [Tulosesus angulatus]
MSFQKRIIPILLLCAALPLYRGIKSLNAMITALRDEILKKEGYIIILRAALEERAEMIAPMEGEVPVDVKVERIKRLKAEIGSKEGLLQDLQEEGQELRRRLLGASLAVKQEGIRSDFDWQAKLAFKDEEIDLLSLNAKVLQEKLRDAKREGVRKLFDWVTKLITKDKEIERLSLDAKTLREKLAAAESEREEIKRTSECQKARLIAREREIETLSNDEKILREKLSECIARLRSSPSPPPPWPLAPPMYGQYPTLLLSERPFDESPDERLRSMTMPAPQMSPQTGPPTYYGPYGSSFYSGQSPYPPFMRADNQPAFRIVPKNFE